MIACVLLSVLFFSFFFLNDPATTEIYTLSLHDALPIWGRSRRYWRTGGSRHWRRGCSRSRWRPCRRRDRKSTRLNSSHVEISYAVFCLKKKKTTKDDMLFSMTQKRAES